MLQDYKPQLDTPKRHGRMAFVYLQATILGGSGAVTIDSEKSSPKVTISRSNTGKYTMTFPKCQFAQFVGGGVQLADSAGSNVYPESLTPASGGVGTFTFETATTPGTAADPATLSRIYVTLLVGGF
jgi:hypothetical protein